VYLSYLLSDLAADLCLGDCSKILQDIQNINIRCEEKKTALHIAAELGALDSVRSLLILNADISLKDHTDKTPVKAARHMPCYRLLRRMEKAQQADSELVKEVNMIDIDSNESIIFRFSEDSQKIVLAVNNEVKTDQVTYIQVDESVGRISLVNHSFRIMEADREIKFSQLRDLSFYVGIPMTQMHEKSISGESDYGWSPLMVAAEAGSVEQIRSLLRANNKFDIQATTTRQRTVLHVAANAGNSAAVAALIEEKASIAAKDDHGHMPLHLAARGGFADIMSLLMQDKPEIVLLKTDLSSVLHCAATASGDAVRCLLGSKAVLDIEEKGPLLRTALHMAAHSDKIDCLSALLELNANILASDTDQKCALDLCTSESCKYVLKMFGAKEWTPLMVVSEGGGERVRQYALDNFAVTACFKSIKDKLPFPSWFVSDVVFYTKLDSRQNWRWGILESKLSKSNDGMQVTKMQVTNSLGAPGQNVSCVIGSEVLEEGVHEWVLKVGSVQSMWVGIARGVNESNLLESHPFSRPPTGGFILAFHSSYGKDYFPLVQASKQPRIRSIPGMQSYSSGDRLTIQLDTQRHILRLKINGVIAVVVSDVDVIGVRPYACMECTESIRLVDQVSHVFQKGNTDAVNKSCLNQTDEISGLNNAAWTPETDASLDKIILEGPYFIILSSAF
jgi:ankyrin repeat protein